MSLLNAPEYDEAAARRRRNRILLVLFIVVAAGSVLWIFRFYPQERIVNSFFTAIEQEDFDRAYGIYHHDPEWKQHLAKYERYPMSDFMRDWGPASEYGKITSHQIAGAQRPPHSGKGVIVNVSINGRPVKIPVYVDSDSSLSVWPY